jgi:hypothetical protein
MTMLLSCYYDENNIIYGPQGAEKPHRIIHENIFCTGHNPMERDTMSFITSDVPA